MSCLINICCHLNIMVTVCWSLCLSEVTKVNDPLNGLLNVHVSYILCCLSQWPDYCYLLQLIGQLFRVSSDKTPSGQSASLSTVVGSLCWQGGEAHVGAWQDHDDVRTIVFWINSNPAVKHPRNKETRLQGMSLKYSLSVSSFFSLLQRNICKRI